MSEKKQPEVKATIIKADDSPVYPIRKSDKSEQLDDRESQRAVEWLTPVLDMHGLKELEQQSSILPQCIRAYKNNIAGFGIGVRYKEDIEETPEMAAEYTRMEEIIELLNFDEDTKEVFEDLVEARETYGIGYLEVIRNIGGEVVQIEFIRDTPTVEKSRQLEPYIDTTFFHKGVEQTRRKKFRRYRQTVGGQTVYFREFGDPRVMNKETGEYAKEGETVELDKQANEIMEFAIGTMPYGEVRWIGQILGVDGSRRAEDLNNNYFKNGRHTPLMIVVKGGTLTEDSFKKLTDYMNGIKGKAGQHAFIVLETEAVDNQAGFDDSQKPDIEIKDLASILQKDELFQEYLDNNRRRVQSSFQLPDLYVGYTTDFNRATAQTAQEVTEKQVFQPERKSLAWAINNRLLNGYNFQYVEAYFKEPDLSNPDDLFKILTVCNNAGGVTPNKAKEVAYTMLGDNFEPFEGEWADTPLVVQKSQQAGLPSITAQLEQQINKAAAANDDAVVAVMKEVRSLLLKMSKEDK
ncbi:phage portal protein [uncultured Ruminococcus sp.]|uniref:phage portal protein n=1 Tax=uncultured Ruminococcus sp. TaxID=165186 RepID=UPI0025FED6F8|nr:phage portal protein [uncultured Ruminococcus sp.]